MVGIEIEMNGRSVGKGYLNIEQYLLSS